MYVFNLQSALKFNYFKCLFPPKLRALWGAGNSYLERFLPPIPSSTQAVAHIWIVHVQHWRFVGLLPSVVTVYKVGLWCFWCLFVVLWLFTKDIQDNLFAHNSELLATGNGILPLWTWPSNFQIPREESYSNPCKGSMTIHDLGMEILSASLGSIRAGGSERKATLSQARAWCEPVTQLKGTLSLTWERSKVSRKCTLPG